MDYLIHEKQVALGAIMQTADIFVHNLASPKNFQEYLGLMQDILPVVILHRFDDTGPEDIEITQRRDTDVVCVRIKTMGDNDKQHTLGLAVRFPVSDRTEPLQSEMTQE